MSKSLSNAIQDIRHTDKHTIPVDGPNIYKLIAKINTSIIEAVILTVPDKYIIDIKLDSIKESYLTSYNIDPNNGWIISKKDIDVDDIPF